MGDVVQRRWPALVVGAVALVAAVVCLWAVSSVRALGFPWPNGEFGAHTVTTREQYETIAREIAVAEVAAAVGVVALVAAIVLAVVRRPLRRT